MTGLADVFRNADPASVEQQLDEKAGELDQLGKDLDAAVDRYDAADEAWLKLYDAVAEDLRNAYIQAGRKTDPAEHVILTETRKQHRAEHTEWKRAKRDVTRIENKMRSLGKVVGARQTQAAGLREEMRAGTFSR